jgi:hypothetical protein
VLTSTQKSNKRIRKLSVAIRKDDIGGKWQAWMRSMAADKRRISWRKHVNKIAVDGGQQTTCSFAGNNKQENHLPREASGPQY